MRTVETIIYNVEDLKKEELKELRDRVLEKHRDINVDYDGWYECIEEDFKEKLTSLGYDDIEATWSGFWSQGDGASFTGEIWISEEVLKRLYPDYNELKQSIKNMIIDNVKINIVRNSYYPHYVHSNTIFAELDTYDLDYILEDHPRLENKVYKVLEIIEDNINKEIKQLSDDYYDDLREYYHEMTSDDQVLETLEANDYEFLEDGSMYY